MSTSANTTNMMGSVRTYQARDFTGAGRWLIAALGCFVFARIYALFSHEVHSVFMDWMFLIPLLAGCVYALGALLVPSVYNKGASRLFGCGVATLTIASTLQGIFEIAGTASPYTPVFVVVGGAIVIASALYLVIKRFVY